MKPILTGLTALALLSLTARASADSPCPSAPPALTQVLQTIRSRAKSERWTGLSHRARSSHWLPRISMGLRRSLGSDAAARLYTDHDQLVTSREDGLSFELHLDFELSQLIYAKDEPLLAQREVERMEALSEAERRILDAYATYDTLRRRCLRGIALAADEEIRLTRAGLELEALSVREFEAP